MSRLVTFGQTPAKIDDDLIGKIRAQSDSDKVQRRHFEPGELVTLTDGPFVGLEAIYQMADGEGRVMVLLHILSKPVQLSIVPTGLKKLN